MLFQGKSPEDVLYALRTWDLLSYLDAIERNSAMFQHVKALIHIIIAD